MNKRSTGADYESKAVEYLTGEGVSVLQRNYRFHKSGEIDIIGKDGEYLVFFEVKYRTSDSMSLAVNAVGYKKQRQICRTALGYLTERNISLDTAIRFDVIAIDGENLEWYKNAFDFVR